MGTPQRVWLFILLGLSLLLLGPPRARAVVIGPGSCVTGTDVCTGNTGDIGTKSCNGDHACFDNTGRIHNHACTGSFACDGNTGAVDNNSCKGVEACVVNIASVGIHSCIGVAACFENVGASVGNGSCQGKDACTFNSGAVGASSCKGVVACDGNSAPVGNNSILFGTKFDGVLRRISVNLTTGDFHISRKNGDFCVDNEAKSALC